MTFPITIHKDDERLYTARCPALPHLIEQGATADEAEYRIFIAIQEELERMGEDHRPLEYEIREIEVPFGTEPVHEGSKL